MKEIPMALKIAYSLTMVCAVVVVALDVLVWRV